MSLDHEGSTTGFGAEEGGDGAVVAAASDQGTTHAAAALIASASSGGVQGAERCSVVDSTASDGGHVPVGHGTAAKLPRCGLYWLLVLDT